MERKNPPLIILSDSRLFSFLNLIVSSIVLFLGFLIFTPLFRLKIEGRENIRGCTKGLLVSNHSLYLDPAIIRLAAAPRRVNFTAMESTFHRPFIGPLIRLLDAFPIPEGEPLAGIRSAVEKVFRRNRYLHFFPEGVLHHHNQDPRPFRHGAFLLSLRLDYPVIPLAICYGKFGLFGAPRVTARIGEPVFPARFAGEGTEKEQIKAMADYTRDRIIEMIQLKQRL